MSRPKKGAPKRASRAVPIAPSWQSWAAANLLRGVARADVASALVAEGLPASAVSALLTAIEGSPLFEAARPFARDARRYAMLTRLQRRLQRASPDATAVPVRPGLSARELRELFLTANAPVVLPDWVPRWRAFGRWTPAYLAERFGDVPVPVTVGREGDPDYDMRHEVHTRTMPLRQFVRMIDDASGATNDFYMVAKNRVLERTALGALLEDVELPDELLDPARLLGSSALWLGPAGTLTPLHHDTSNILFCQLHGRKRIRLASPHETALLDGARSMYAAAEPPPPDVLLKDVTLEPGHALFIPVGWWHQVRALDPSISLALNNFRPENDFDWYRPGEVS